MRTIARFTMNLMSAEGRYPWIIFPVIIHNEYMSALEKVSLDKDIDTFAQFVSDRVKLSFDEISINTLSYVAIDGVNL